MAGYWLTHKDIFYFFCAFYYLLGIILVVIICFGLPDTVLYLLSCKFISNLHTITDNNASRSHVVRIHCWLVGCKFYLLLLVPGRRITRNGTLNHDVTRSRLASYIAMGPCLALVNYRKSVAAGVPWRRWSFKGW